MKVINSQEPVVITQGNKVLQPQFDKLIKTERLLTKIENDIQRRKKDIDRNTIVDILKKVRFLDKEFMKWR